ncbi:MAG: hypothetical protein JSS81_24185 [Acidobacteria bacterium]|nr:hypothetical protein [Acidobacteriota bacterium]
MNLKILAAVLIAAAMFGGAAGQQLKLKRSGNTVRVLDGRRVLYGVTLRGPSKNGKRGPDEAFLAGPCLIVRRNVREPVEESEIPPTVARLEIYRRDGRRVVYRDSQLALGYISDWELINSPDFSWAIIPDDAEAMWTGFFHISTDCRITAVAFDANEDFEWGSREDGEFVDSRTLRFSSVPNSPRDGRPAGRVEIVIMKDGSFRVTDAGR